MAYTKNKRHVSIGQTFGSYEVISLAPRRGKRVYWNCLCSCGTHREVREDGLTCGTTLSCGCQRVAQLIKRLTKHGQSNKNKTKEYQSWDAMIQRCTNPNTSHYHDYGGRGISVCHEWRVSFERFLADMGKCPHDCSLDRIDNSGNYEPANCRWATVVQQHRNMRSNRMIAINGVTLCAVDWAKRVGLNQNTLFKRLHSGWSEYDAVMTPVKRRAVA